MYAVKSTSIYYNDNPIPNADLTNALAAILVSRPGGDSLYCVHKDHLGSILTLTNHQGSVVERYSFDAWGRRRNPTDWSQKASGIGYITDRGYTGHQHMDLFGLISMSNEVRSRLFLPAGNGRIYDPGLGRFLSPDPYVQMPQNTQNFNRYSYALNNPLVYTDPSGYRIQGSPQYNGASAFFYTQEVLGNGNMSNPFNTTSAYSYDYATNTYRNAAGRRVPFNEVKHNYVLPNASTVYYSAGVSHSNIKSSVVGYAKTFSSITDKALEMNFLMKNNIVYHVRAQNGRYIVVSFYPMVTTTVSGGNSEAWSLTIAGLGLMSKWGESGAKVFQGSNAAIRTAAIKNGIPTDAIDEIMRKTSNFKSISKYAGRGFVVAGVVVNIIDGVQAYNQGNIAGVKMAGMDIFAGLGTAAIGGPPGLILYGGYILVMHTELHTLPACVADPMSTWNTMHHKDNTYVSTNY